MDTWLIALAIVVIVLLGWWVRGRIDGPADREYEEWAKRCLEKQALKRGGGVKMSGRRAVLTAPYKAISIEVFKAPLPGSEDNEYFL